MKTNKRNFAAPLTIWISGAVLIVLCLLQPNAVKAQWTSPDGNGNINNTNSGNVGVGTTGPNYKFDISTALDRAQVRFGMGTADSGGFLYSGGPSHAVFSGGASYNSGWIAKSLSASMIEANLGQLTFYTNSGLSTGSAFTPAARMAIASDGRVGIGTTTPSGLLTLRVTGGDVIQAFSNAGGSSGELHLRYKFESALHRIGLTDSFGNWFFYTQYASPTSNSIGFFPGRVGIGVSSPLYSLDVTGGVNGFRAKATTVSASDSVAAFENNNGIQFIVRGNGNVGIGTTSPNYKLHVQGGSVNASDGLCINNDCKTAWSQIGSQWANGSGGAINYASGNVGIGTTSPQRLLQLHASASPVFQLTDGTSGSAGTDGFQIVQTGLTSYLQNQEAGSLILRTAATDRMLINSSGNVGIATASPTEKLEVTGNVKVSGTVEGGNIKARYQDVAEWVDSSQELEAGTVVVLDSTRTNQVVAATQAYDSRVAGVISLRPGLVLGEEGEGRVLVATTGRVKVKVDATKGPIEIGDLLVTSHKEGFAMKSLPVKLGTVRMHRPGTLIGKALEPLAKGTGEILVLLSMQ